MGLMDLFTSSSQVSALLEKIEALKVELKQTKDSLDQAQQKSQ